MSNSIFRRVPGDAVSMGISQAQWTTLCNLYPGALDDSIMSVYEYCDTRKLDVFKKPVHIVPMSVKDSKTGKYSTIDIVMPGIAELRTTAIRTGLYAGIDEPEFGPSRGFPISLSDPDGPQLVAPEWCKVTVYRMVSNKRFGWTHIEFFAECVARTKDGVINAMWLKRYRGQTAKCTEAGALRKAFPEELGGVMSADEMIGRDIEEAPEKQAAQEIPAPAEIADPEPIAEPEAQAAAHATDVADAVVIKAGPRYWSHPESHSVFVTAVGEAAPTDPLCHEISHEEFLRLDAERAARAKAADAAKAKPELKIEDAEPAPPQAQAQASVSAPAEASPAPPAGMPHMALPEGPASIVNARLKSAGVTVEQLAAKLGAQITVANINQALAMLRNWGS